MRINGSDNLQEAATKGVEAIQAIVTERDGLRNAHDRMTTEALMLREKNIQLESRLDTASSERDHYMRHSVELITRLNNIQTLISSCIEEAGFAAYKPPPAPAPNKRVPVLSEQEVEQLEHLMNKLPKNGGSQN